MVDDLETTGNNSLCIVAGSSPTLNFYAKQPGVDCCPGTFIYWDQYYKDTYPELAFEFAAMVITRVISNPDLNSACLDLGYKATPQKKI